MSNKLQEVTDKICELLKGTELEVKQIRPVWSSEYFLENILLWHVLAALEIHSPNSYLIDTSGHFTGQSNGELDMGSKDAYSLNGTLSNQSPETIESLHQILVR